MSAVPTPVQPRIFEKLYQRPSFLGGGAFKLTTRWIDQPPPFNPSVGILKPYFYTVAGKGVNMKPPSDPEPTHVTVETRPSKVCIQTSNPGGSWMLKNGGFDGYSKTLYGFCVHGEFEARTCKECAFQRLVTLVEAHKKGIIGVKGLAKEMGKEINEGSLDEVRSVYFNTIVQCVCKGHTCKSCLWESMRPTFETPLTDTDYWDTVDQTFILHTAQINHIGVKGCDHKGSKDVYCDHRLRWSACKNVECSKKELGTGSMFCSGCGRNKGRGPCCLFGTQILTVEEMHRYVNVIPLDIQMQLLGNHDNLEEMTAFFDAPLKEVELFKKPWMWVGRERMLMTFLRKEDWGEWMVNYLMDMRDPVKHALANMDLPRLRVKRMQGIEGGGGARGKLDGGSSEKKQDGGDSQGKQDGGSGTGSNHFMSVTQYLAKMEPVIRSTPLWKLDTSAVAPREGVFKPAVKRVVRDVPEVPEVPDVPVMQDVPEEKGEDEADVSMAMGLVAMSQSNGGSPSPSSILSSSTSSTSSSSSSSTSSSTSSSSSTIKEMINECVRDKSARALTLTKGSFKSLMQGKWDEPTPLYFRGAGKRRFMLMEVEEKKCEKERVKRAYVRRAPKDD